MQLLRQIQARGHSAIVYDPGCEFIQRYYDDFLPCAPWIDDGGHWRFAELWISEAIAARFAAAARMGKPRGAAERDSADRAARCSGHPATGERGAAASRC